MEFPLWRRADRYGALAGFLKAMTAVLELKVYSNGRAMRACHTPLPSSLSTGLLAGIVASYLTCTEPEEQLNRIRAHD